MDWVPKSIEQLRLLIGEHEFAAGFCVALFFITIMRQFFFRSSERVLQQMIDELRKKCKNLETALRNEQSRVKACHQKLAEQTNQVKEV